MLNKLNDVFQNGARFLNIEIIYPGTKNVIMYGPKAYIQFHGVDEYDCYLDYPIFEPIVFSHIVDEYSDAKYISLTRGYDDYVESVLKDKIKRLDEGIENSWNWLGVGEVEVFENYPQYQKDWIKEKTMFKHISNLRWLDKKNIDYLEMNICDDKDGWKKLCGYLSHAIPENDFPNTK